MVVFDNNQVMQRRLQMSLNNAIKSSTTTIVAFLEMPQLMLMYSPYFTPEQWMWSQFPADVLEQLFSCEALGRRHLYQHHLHPWLTKIFMEVTAEQLDLQNGQFKEPVDQSVRKKNHSKKFKIWPNCGDINMSCKKRLCRNCNMSISAARFLKVQRLHENQPQEKTRKLRKLGLISTAIMTPSIHSATRNRPPTCITILMSRQTPPRETHRGRHGWIDLPEPLLIWCFGCHPSWHQ